MQENIRFSPRQSVVRQIYFGRIVAFISVICFSVAAGVLFFSYRSQNKAARQAYEKELTSFVAKLVEDVEEVVRETERAEISEPLATKKIIKLYTRVKEESETYEELLGFCDAFSRFFAFATIDGTVASLKELARAVSEMQSMILAN